jgi:HD superfamily phosphodiesterase
LSARPLSPKEQRYVHDQLSKPCADLFWKQGFRDQRHALTVARRVAAKLPGDQEAIEAALLHDIGKWQPNTGAISRSVATVLQFTRLPMTPRMWAYRDHGRRGSAELEEARCGSLAIEFARLHPAPVPEGFDPERWQVLLEADG